MKKTLYFLLTIFLLLELSFLLHLTLLTILGLAQVEPACVLDSVPLFNSFCLFPGWARATTMILGLVAGSYVAPWWWRIVYVEKRWKGF